ncbi:hypothetical protein KJ688_16600 [bacterium]|nr:hypothetical protein [bacterium]
MKRLTYLKAIRKFCIECMGGRIYLPTDCPAVKCKFYPYRMGKIPDTKPGATPLKSIRLYCLECVGTSDEVKICSAPECPVYYYRFGKNPGLKSNNPKGNIKALEIIHKRRLGAPVTVQDSTKVSKPIANHRPGQIVV